jgi:hypothetical protein
MTTPAETRLRAHHFICLQFFRGEGYSANFVENLTRVLNGAVDAPALLVEGADDVCAACPGLSADGTCADPDAGEAEVQRLDALAREVLGMAAGDRLSLAAARERLSADAIGVGRWRFEACDGCGWEAICEAGWGGLVGEAERAATSSE